MDKRRKKLLGTFVEACGEWQGRDTKSPSSSFPVLLYWAKSNFISVRDLAAEFEVSPTTILRWSTGVAKPHVKIQEHVVERLLELVKEIQ